MCPCISSLRNSWLSLVESCFSDAQKLLFLSCVYFSTLSTTLQAPPLVVLMDLSELYIFSFSAYPLWHWPNWVCSSAWFEVTISSLTNINTYFSSFLLCLVSVLSSVGVSSRDIWKWYSFSAAFGCCTGQKIGMYVMLWGAIADAGTERAERFLKAHLSFTCEHSWERRRLSQHHFWLWHSLWAEVNCKSRRERMKVNCQEVLKFGLTSALLWLRYRPSWRRNSGMPSWKRSGRLDLSSLVKNRPLPLPGLFPSTFFAPAAV